MIKRKYVIVRPSNMDDPLWSGTFHGINCSDCVIRADNRMLIFDTIEEANNYVKKDSRLADGWCIAVLAWETKDDKETTFD